MSIRSKRKKPFPLTIHQYHNNVRNCGEREIDSYIRHIYMQLFLDYAPESCHYWLLHAVNGYEILYRSGVPLSAEIFKRREEAFKLDVEAFSCPRQRQLLRLMMGLPSDPEDAAEVADQRPFNRKLKQAQPARADYGMYAIIQFEGSPLWN